MFRFFVLLFFVFQFPFAAFAAKPSLRFSESLVKGSVVQVVSESREGAILKEFLFDSDKICYQGEYGELKMLIHALARQYNVEEGGIASIQLDTKTLNGKFSELKVIFKMNSGAEWTWSQVKRCK